MNTVYGKYKLLSDFEFDELFFLEKPKDEFIVFFELLIKELTNYCKNNGLDPSIKFVGSGMTSAVYSIGDKIIKIGIPRRNECIPYCEYLLQPIINRDFEFDGYPIHIEVTQKVLVYQDIKKYCSIITNLSHNHEESIKGDSRNRIKYSISHWFTLWSFYLHD